MTPCRRCRGRREHHYHDNYSRNTLNYVAGAATARIPVLLFVRGFSPLRVGGGIPRAPELPAGPLPGKSFRSEPTRSSASKAAARRCVCLVEGGSPTHKVVNFGSDASPRANFLASPPINRASLKYVLECCGGSVFRASF